MRLTDNKQIVRLRQCLDKEGYQKVTLLNNKNLEGSRGTECSPDYFLSIGIDFH